MYKCVPIRYKLCKLDLPNPLHYRQYQYTFRIYKYTSSSLCVILIYMCSLCLADNLTSKIKKKRPIFK